MLMNTAKGSPLTRAKSDEMEELQESWMNKI